jgi:hypothetical protein
MNIWNCIQEKMTTKVFSKVERNTNFLKLVYSDLYELNGILIRGEIDIL